MDPTDLGPGTATWLGGSATVVPGGLLWLRRFLSKDATDRAMDSADTKDARTWAMHRRATAPSTAGAA